MLLNVALKHCAGGWRSRRWVNRMSRITWVGALVAGALTMSACTFTSEAPKGITAAGGGKVVYAETFPPVAAWALESDDAFTLMRAGCLEALVRYEADNSVVGGLAESWKQTKPTAWDFTLREGVTFQDGSPVNAEAVVGALEHALGVTAPARSFNPDVIAGVKALNQNTVRVSTKEPDILVPLRLAGPNSGILAPKAYAGKQIDIAGTCTGPFEVVQQVGRESLKLKANESYRGGDVALDSAEVRFLAEGDARATQIQTGEVQIASYIPPGPAVTIKQDEKIKLETREMPRTTGILLNNDRPPFDNPAARKALRSALNLDAITASVYEGAAKPAIGPFSPNWEWSPPGASPAPFDPKRAKRILADAGIDPSSMAFELVAYTDRAEFADLAAIIQDQLVAIGVKAKIKAGEYGALEPDLLDGKYDATLMSRGYLTDLADPVSYLKSDYGCKGSYNLSQYCDPATDALIEKATSATDAERRNKIYAQVAERLQDDAVSVFLVNETVNVAVSRDIENFRFHPLNHYVLTADLAVTGK